ncbi:hypothetical protein IEO21_03652 [Rhodonia placenta]|uniref:Uncharacterized protein n=1 Tax=Rhodonia placenta TaxID=104341 RepID=A0A8H7U407_9APHY|nr:hypothetical protein IEO21_03652 [Postia placenta]
MSSGSSSPTSPSSTTTQPDGSKAPSPGHAFPIYWSRVPSIKIVRQPKGRYSPQVDERCLMYCAQTVRGRTEQREPWCRSMCLRRVFAHEVSRVLATASGQTASEQPAAARTKIPLPPEGQRTPSLAQLLVGAGDGEHERMDAEARRWEEGYYLWLSRSRWAAQEKLDLMQSDLERQAWWQRYKQQATERWEEQERRRGAAAKGGPPAKEAEADPSAASQQGRARPQDVMYPKRPYPDLIGESILLPIPPSLPPIGEQVATLLAPTRRLLALTNESVDSGAQVQLMQRMWEKAWTNEPFVLARNVCSRMWERFTKGPPDDSP